MTAFDLNRALAAPLSAEELAGASVHQDNSAQPEMTIVCPAPSDAPSPRFWHPKFGTPSRTWSYLDAAGQVLGYVARFDPPFPATAAGEAPNRKQFSPYTLWRTDGGLRWKWKNWTGLRPLYGLDRLAAAPDAPVIILEGEKSSDAAQRVFSKSVAVTSSGGAEAAHKTDWSPLAGRRVLIWPDVGPAGADYARAVSGIALEAGAIDVQVVDAVAIASQTAQGGRQEPADGWDVADALDEGWDLEALRKAVFAATLKPVEKPQYLSFGAYKMGSRGLFFEGGEGEKSWICEPFEILAAARDDVGGNWGLMLRWRDPDNRGHTWAMPKSMVYGDGGVLCGALAEQGLGVAPGPKSKNLLLAYLASARPKGRVTCANRTGWHEVDGRPVYVMPEQTIGEDNGSRIVLQSASVSARSPFAAKGSLGAWREHVARPSELNSRLAFSISAALAGPLLWLTGAEGGGFHIFGGSSQGKTTALQVAASVWGRGEKGGFVNTWRGTANGMEGMASMHSDATLILDEIGQADAKTVAEACYMLAQGIGKTRATRNGSTRASNQWRVLILSSGEITATAKIAEERGRRSAAGQMIRLLDMPSDAGRGLGAFDYIPAGLVDAKALADHLKEATRASFGVAGPALVEAIAQDPDAARASVRSFVEDWSARHCPPGADGQVRRAVDRCALVAAAGEFAAVCGVLPWQEGSASKAAARMLADWIALRGGVEPAEISAGIAQVRRFIEAYGESRFSALGVPDERVIPNRAGFRKGYDSEREWIILPETWRSEVVVGHDPALLARAMAERGMLRVGSDGKPQVKTHIPALGNKVRAYVLTDRLFAEETVEFDKKPLF